MSASNVSVLVVDDDLAVCRIVNRMLSDEHYQVQISQSVADAISAIERKAFDVYVLDYKLPDGTGLDVAERIRSKGSDSPIILISGYDPAAVGLRAEKLRILDIIEKPFARATMCTAVKKAIGFSSFAEEPNVSSVIPGPDRTTEKRRKRFPASALIGATIFLLLFACFAVYLLMH
jgi:two-component system, NtrC family, response regulator HydG